MLLVVSVGNTTVRMGGFEDGDEPAVVQTVPSEYVDELEAPDAYVEALVLGSVNPIVASRVHLWAEDALFCPVLEFRVDLPNPMRMLCEEAWQVGADRVANAIALHKRTGRGGVVVDFGTATSFARVSPEGDFRGGAIAPGLAMSARALHEETALLPHVDPVEAPPAAGCNTEEALAAGLLWGHGGMVDRIIERLTADRPDAPVLATGGGAERLLPYCERVDTIVPHLTLEGFREVYLRRPQ